MRPLLVTALLALGGVAHAEPTAPHGYAGAKLGGIAPLDGLSPFATVGVEVAYVLPAASHHVAVGLVVDYTQPTTRGTEMDPRVTGGSYTWQLTERELGVMPVVLYRARPMGTITPYAGIGPRLLLTRSTVEDDGAPTIEATEEVSTEFGFGVPVGGELPLGPGRLTGELLLQYGTLDHTATGDSHAGAVSLAVGYRMIL